MAVYAIVLDDDPDVEAVHQIITTDFPDHLRFNVRVWFVSAQATTPQKLGAQLGIPDKLKGVVVFRMTPAYWGAARQEVWDWLKGQFEKTDG